MKESITEKNDTESCDNIIVANYQTMLGYKAVFECIGIVWHGSVEANKRTWKECLHNFGNFEISLNHLLDGGVLPDQKELDFIIERIGRKSQIARRICAEICAYLTHTYEGVVSSSAAYRYGNGCDDKKTEEDLCIVFILLKKNDSEISCQEYRTYERCNKISPMSEKMNRHISLFERKQKLPFDQLEKLVSFVQHQSYSLCKQHRNLIMVSSSWCKARGFRTEKEQITCIPCIALYVHTKGLIPLDEDPFETTIDGYSVDVREGVFTPFCGANDLHRNLKMGCAITGGQTSESGSYMGGTLGAFVQLAANKDIFAITSAHVVLDHLNLKQVLENNDVTYGKTNPAVFHPVQEPLNSFGHIVFATHTQGVNGKSGMEIAVIQMNPDRWPLDGSFPHAPNHSQKGFDQSNPFSFKSGKYCDIPDLHHSPLVMKYGSTTKLTEGRVRVSGSTVKAGILNDSILGYPLMLHNQIEIEFSDSECFAEPGDSGALVLTRTKEGLVAVGILEGKCNDVYIVTPMKAILEDLSSKIGVCRLLSFDQFSCASATDADLIRQNESTEIPQKADTSVNLMASAPSSKQIENLQSEMSAHHMHMENMQQRMAGLENNILNMHESVNRIENMIGSLISQPNHKGDS